MIPKVANRFLRENAFLLLYFNIFFPSLTVACLGVMVCVVVKIFPPVVSSNFKMLYLAV